MYFQYKYIIYTYTYIYTHILILEKYMDYLQIFVVLQEVEL